MTQAWLPWRLAMERALYGWEGFYRRERPADHFRTSTHTSELFATAVARLAAEIHDRLGSSARMTVVEVGAGGGELLGVLADLLPSQVQLIGVDLSARPGGLPGRVSWRSDLPVHVDGLVFANEWLDNVPLDVAEVDGAGRPRLVLVEPSTGDERLGPVVTSSAATWLARNWPIEGAPEGTRGEIGTTRDVAWTRAVATLRTGVAVAVDYHHRCDSRPHHGTLTGFRAGREMRPVPDGSCDLTAHVALDACAVAVSDAHTASRSPAPAGGLTTSLCSQREALRALGIRGDLPSRADAAVDPAGYLRALSRTSEATELTDPHGLGGFGWLAHARGVPMPSALPRSDRAGGAHVLSSSS